MRTTARRIACGLLACYALAFARYTTVWENELTAWTWAVTVAPLKPRPRIQRALALAERRRFLEASAELDVAEALTQSVTLPSYDRRAAIIAVRENRAMIARLTEPQ